MSHVPTGQTALTRGSYWRDVLIRGAKALAFSAMATRKENAMNKDNTIAGRVLARVVAAGCASALLLLAAAGGAAAENIRGASTGPTTAPGFNHSEQYMHLKAVAPADNMYPVVQHPEQDKAAQDKLAALAQKTGKKPNILIFLLDDVGWMDPGFNGGGVAVGNATPNMDRLANEGLLLTSAYSTPSCSPTRATIHTGQNPLHHGILRPPMYGEPGGLDGATTMPDLLKKQGYITQGVGKWHMGENQGSLPQNVGYDDYVGFLGVSDMYTEWRDVYFNPEVALSPDRFKMMEDDVFSHYEVHCTPSDKKQCVNGKLIDLDYIKDLDKHWLDVSVAFLDKMKGSKQPFYLYHATRGCHFDNYPSDEWAASRWRVPCTATAWCGWTTYSANSWTSSRRSVRRRTPSSSSPQTTDRNARSRRADARRSAVARAQAGKAACGSRPSSTGRP